MSSSKSLDIQLGDVNVANLEQLKIMNISSLPVRYTDKFYKELVEKSPKEYLKFAFCNGFAVGAVCSRIEAHEHAGFSKLYIMTISVLPAYRKKQIGDLIIF
jgi:N-alpha-acetyltransferase 50